MTRPFPADAARPQPVYEHPESILVSGSVVDTFHLKFRHHSALIHRR